MAIPTTKGSLGASTLEITNFNGGLNVIKSDHDILDSQSASCLNVYNAEILGLDARYGYSKYYASSITTASINALFIHNDINTSTFLFAAGGVLYKDLAGAGVSSVFSGMATGEIRSFEMLGNLYLLDGSGYIQYNSISGASIVSGKIPTYWIDTSPDGTGGDKLEELNFLSSAFVQTFNGDGHSVVFQSVFGDLTTGLANFITINGTTQVSGVDYTVNYAVGSFTFAIAPSTGIGNVSIQTHAYIYNPDEITNCTLCTPYGIGNSVNVYLAGNPIYPERLYWSDTSDPTYYPSTSYAEIGIKNDKTMGLLSHANSLLIFKYRSIHAWTGAPPNNSVLEIYVGEGLISTDSLKLADGFPTFFSQRGVCILEKQDLGYVLTLISEDVNGIPNIRDGMITEALTARQASRAFVKDKKYFLWLNNKIWIYQYNLKRTEAGQNIYPWIPWTSVNNFNYILGFSEKDDYMYFSAQNNIFKFDPLRFDDDGAAINSYWLSKQFYMGQTYDIIKSFDYQYWHLKAYSNIATSDLLLTEHVSGYTNGKILQMVPNLTTQYVRYDVRQHIHYKANSIQYSINQNTVSGGFSLLSTKILFQGERKNITV